MKHQTDPEFNGIINHFGCYFFSLLYKVEKMTRPDKPFTSQEINDIYKAAMQTGIIGKETWVDGVPTDGCFVKDPEALLHFAGAMNAKFMGRVDVVKDIPKNIELIQAWHNDRTGFTHFVSGKDNKTVEFDPIMQDDGSGSITVKEGKIQSYRLIMFKE